MAKKAPKEEVKRVDPEAILEEFTKMKAGSPDEKVTALAKYFKKSEDYIKRKLKEEMAGSEYRKTFPDSRGGVVRWDVPTGKLLKALNSNRTLAEAAAELETTSVTLNRAIERHNLVQVWVQQED